MIPQGHLQYTFDLLLQVGFYAELRHRFPGGGLQETQHLEGGERDPALLVSRAGWAEHPSQLRAVSAGLRLERRVATGAVVQGRSIAKLIEQMQLKVAKSQPATALQPWSRRPRVQQAKGLDIEV